MRTKGSRLIILLIIILGVLTAVNIKTIGRYFYPIKYSNYIIKYSKQYNLDPYMVAAVVKTESNFNPKAKSSKNAYGLMQVTESTGICVAEALKIKNFNSKKLYEPEFNINFGCWYLKDLKNEFKSMNLVIAAYNGGRGNVKKWLKDPNYSSDGKTLKYIPFKETDQYLKKVNTNYRIYKWLYGK